LYHCRRAKSALYDVEMTIAVWASLGFLVIVLVGSIALAAARAWRLWRRFREVSTRVTSALEQVQAAGDAAEARASALAGGGGERLTEAADRLQVSLDELAVLGRAAAEARTGLATLRGFVPRK
jgi:hypothetical protein